MLKKGLTFLLMATFMGSPIQAKEIIIQEISFNDEIPLKTRARQITNSEWKAIKKKRARDAARRRR